MKRAKKLFSLALAGILAASVLVGCSSKETTTNTEENNTVAPTKLTLYAGLMEEHAIEAAKEFEKETGIKVEFVRMSSGEILGRIRAEKENPKASVWFGGPADAFIAAQTEGLLEKYESPNASVIPAKFKDADNYWTGIYLGYLGFVSNDKFLKEKGVAAPTSWDDLLKPEFKGHVVMANPGSSGTAYTALATVVQMRGEEDGLAYMRELHGQISQYTKSGTAPGRMAGLGEAGVGITFLHDAIKYREEGFSDIVLSVPEEGTGYEIGAVAIIAGAPEMEAAKMFIDWTLTKKAQELGQSIGSYQFLTNPEATPPHQADEIKDTKLMEYDFSWAGENRGSLTEKWNDAIK